MPTMQEYDLEYQRTMRQPPTTKGAKMMGEPYFGECETCGAETPDEQLEAWTPPGLPTWDADGPNARLTCQSCITSHTEKTPR